MAKSDRPQNLAIGIPPLGGAVVERLNAIDPGLGTLLAQQVNHRLGILSSRQAAQAGHRGTVHIAGGISSSDPGLNMNNQIIRGVSSPKQDSDAVNLEYFRRFKDCTWFEQMFEDCIEAQVKKAGSIGPPPSFGDIIPWFFGYLVHPPNELDTHHGDMENNGRTNLWPFVLTHASTINKITFGILDHFFFVPNPKINVGLVNTDLQLVCETGGVDIRDPSKSTGWQKGDYYQTTLSEAVDVDAGEYYLAFSTNSCIDIWAFNANATPIFPFLNKSKLRFIEAITTTGYDNFPADFTTETLESLFDYDRVRIPIVLFEK